MAGLERSLAAQDSATAALADWCRVRRIAEPPLIRAERIAGEMPPPAEARALLAAGSEERIAYRNVRLNCGERTLSVARNWYVPGRLPLAMQEQLETSDTPFGKVIAPLRFTRERLASRRGKAAGCPSGTVLSHRALLRLPDRRPVSYVVECYTRANLVSGSGGAPAAARPPS